LPTPYAVFGLDGSRLVLLPLLADNLVADVPLDFDLAYWLILLVSYILLNVEAILF